MKRIEVTIHDEAGQSMAAPVFVEDCSELPLAVMRAVEDFLEAHDGRRELPVAIHVGPSAVLLHLLIERSTPKKPRDPHGVAPDRSASALLLVDVINDFDFPAGRQLLRYALPAAKHITALKKQLRARGVPAIYVNDNFGRWRSDFKKQVERCVSDDCAGAPIARLLIPSEDDYFVLKPKHSGFYSTSLDVLLSYLGVRKLIITGFAGDICVLYTANDAYMRDYELIVPADCLASETAAANRAACQQMKRFLRAETRTSRAIRITSLL